MEKPLKSNASLKLKIEAKSATHNFLYVEEGAEWKTLKSDVDARFLITKQEGGFVGTIYGMYTTSLGKVSDNSASFNWIASYI